MLRAVDISSAQAGINPAELDCDIVIIKATGGTTYTNGYPSEDEDYWRKWADATLASGKKLALYHYAMEYGAYSDAAAEARHFLGTIADYIGRAALILDFEADAQNLPVSWPREWLDAVAAETGSTPFFYAYAAYLNSRDHSELTRYPLWMASYLSRYSYGGWVDDPDNIWPTGSWGRMAMYQYASTGRIGGWGGNLDLSVFYGGGDDWDAIVGGADHGRMESMVQRAIGIAEDDSRGYSQAIRWPWEGSDFDCSSLVYFCAHEAGYSVPLAGYTGTMLADFTNAGFTAHPYGAVELRRGDILLAHNDGRQHTEIYIGDGLTVGAHSSETGGIYGQPGDQTGNEISVAPIWGEWDYVLRPPAERSVKRKDNRMQCLIKPDGKDYMVYFDGSRPHPLEHPDEMKAIEMCYAQCNNGAQIPVFEMGDEKNPWATRLFEGASREFE